MLQIADSKVENEAKRILFKRFVKQASIRAKQACYRNIILYTYLFISLRLCIEKNNLHSTTRDACSIV